MNKVATVGTFDGVHRGHRLILETLKVEGKRRGLAPLVLTFDRHPLEVIAPGRAPGMIMSPDERDALLRSFGTEVVRLEFTDRLRRLTAAEWLSRMAREYDVKALVLGYDNTFGSDCLSLSTDDYIRLGREVGIEVIPAPALPGCSSSAARRALAAGDTARAAEILGRTYTLTGSVTHGRQFGRTIGIPTANLTIPSSLLTPAPGVYSATASLPEPELFPTSTARPVTDGIPGEATRQPESLPAVVNIGHAPTVADNGPLTIEAHIIGFHGNLYDRALKLTFGPRLRDEQRFPDIAALQAQLQADIAAALATQSNQSPKPKKDPNP